MKNWPLILERAIEDVNEAFGVNVTEYGRYLVERGGRDRPHAACHLDVEYERTDQALKAAWRRIADLPKQIADDVPDPSIRLVLGAGVLLERSRRNAGCLCRRGRFTFAPVPIE